MEISEALFVVVFLIGGVFGILVGIFCSVKILDDIYKYKRKDDGDDGN